MTAPSASHPTRQVVDTLHPLTAKIVKGVLSTHGYIQGGVAGQKIAFTFTASDGTQIKASTTLNKQGFYAISQDVKGLVDGPLHITATMPDTGWSGAGEISKNTVKGGVSVALQATTDTVVSITGTTQDVAPGAKVAITLKDSTGALFQAQATVQKDGTYTVRMDMKKAVDGTLALEARVTDRNGTTHTAKGKDSLDVLDSAITATAHTTPDKVVFSGTTTDVAPGHFVRLLITKADGTQQVLNAKVAADGTYTISRPLKLYPEGPLSITAEVSDRNGNRIITQAQSEIDLIKGSVAVDFDTINPRALEQTMVRGTTTDVAPGSKVVITATDQEGHAVRAIATVNADGSYTAAMDLRAFADGAISLSAYATDRNGKTHTATDTATLDAKQGALTVDIDGLNTPKTATLSGTTVDVRRGNEVAITVTDSTGKSLTFTAQVNDLGAYSTKADLSGMTPGSLAVTASAMDRNGNTHAAGDTATLDAPAPEPQPEEPAGPTLPPQEGQAEAVAGRVTTIDTSDITNLKAITIIEQGAHGHVSVNPDKSLSLVLSEDVGNTTPVTFTYQITHQDGSTRNVTTTVTPKAGVQEKGWGQGEFYMLETDANGMSMIEHGDNHREVYVSAGTHALSLEAIAAKEGVPVKTITGSWLAEHPEYGSSPQTALDEKAGIALWHAITGSKAEPSSNWLRLESGHTYDDMGVIIRRGTQGESALHPVVITAYGEGDRPIIANAQVNNTPDNHHIVIKGIDFDDGLQFHQGSNFLVEDAIIRNDTLTAKGIDNFTVRNSSILDVVREESVSDGLWSPHINRISGMFANDVSGLLIENNVLDRVGWADDYKADLSLEGGQPPSIYSQGLYLSFGNSDLTLRDNILMRAASFGAQVRSGGMIEDNIFLDNNAAVNFLGGTDLGATSTGNYTLLLDNLITSGAHRDVSASPRGALTMGIDNSGRLSTMIGNIVAHLADPDNPAELAAKPVGHKPIIEKFAPVYNDTKVFNWVGGKNKANTDANNRNLDGLDKAVLNETTIQQFTADLLGKPKATIADLAAYLRAQADGKLASVVDADLINAFFREGFGMDTTVRAPGDVARFAPNDLADGMRWDNRLNWSDHTQPGQGDDVDLGGNRVFFGAQTLTIDDLDFGRFGELRATSGKLSIDGTLAVAPTGAAIEIAGTGQIWVDGYADRDILSVEVTGGRFANTGTIDGTIALTAAQKGQALLAMGNAHVTLGANSELTLSGSGAKMGMDGAKGQVATLAMEAGSSTTLVADDKGFGRFGEFRSGALFDTPSDPTTAIALGGDLDINVSALVSAQKYGTFRLMEADEIVSAFDSIDVEGLGRGANARVVIDHQHDTIDLILTAGTGQTTVSHLGDMGTGGMDAHHASLLADSPLW